MPNIGYGTKKADRFKARKTGKYSFVVRNKQDLECVKDQGDLYDVYLGRSLSVQTRSSIIEKAERIWVESVEQERTNEDRRSSLNSMSHFPLSCRNSPFQNTTCWTYFMLL